MNIFVIIPSYNEAEVIQETVSKLLHFGYTIVVVDDCSTDNTDKVLRDLPVVYLRHGINLGQGAALQTGMDYAFRNGADYAVHFDADGQHNPEDIPLFIRQLEENDLDIVLGSRFIRDEDQSAVPKRRRIILKIAKLINGIFTGLWLTDAHNGFRVMNREALAKVHLSENRMAHATEILQIIKNKKLRYAEHPTQIVYSAYSVGKGQSNLNSINILIDIILKRIL